MPDSERSSDTSETFGSQQPPSGVSNQNSEEESAPAGDGPGKREAHKGGPDEGHSGDSGEGKPGDSDEGKPGGAGEGSQSTGHPQNAG